MDERRSGSGERGGGFHRALRLVLVYGVLIWSGTQVLMTRLIAEQDELLSPSCVVDLPKGRLVAITAALVVSVLASTGLLFTRWRPAATWSLALSVGLGIAWIAAGGLDAFRCVTTV